MKHTDTRRSITQHIKLIEHRNMAQHKRGDDVTPKKKYV